MSQSRFENVDIPRDRYGRPMVMAPDGKKRVAYRRATTFVKALDDMTGLMKWHSRMVALGMGQRSDLVLAAAATEPGDKRKLGEIAEKAAEHAKGMSGDAAETGTALHKLTERVDRGEKLGAVPAEFRDDIKAYRRATEGIEFFSIETFRVHDKFQVAGTADRIGSLHGRVMIMDIKTGSIDFPHAMAMQLAMYSRSTPYDIATDTRHDDRHPVDPNRGVIIHLPAGQGRCDLYEIDLSHGWGACMIAKQVWDWRGRRGLTQLIDPSETPGAPPTWESLIRDARGLDDLRLVWTRAGELGQLTPELKAAAKARSKDFAA